MDHEKMDFRSRLLWADAEKFFRTNHQVFENCIQKLIEVSELRLYKHGGFSTFKEFFAHHFPGVPYQTVKWSISGERKKQGRKLVEDTTGEETQNDDKQPPKSSSPSENKNDSLPSAPAKKTFDLTGREVHPTILPLFQRQNELNPLLTAISKMRCEIEKRRQEDDPIFQSMNQSVLPTLDMVHHYISSAKLVYVCGFCQGKCKVLAQVCPHCHDTGLMTKDQWERGVPLEIKRMVAANRKDHA